MSPDKEKAIIEACPNLYRADGAETLMKYGFPGDGWFDLILELSKGIEELIVKLPEDKKIFYKAFEVKEKLGSLRFYMTDSTKEMNDLIYEAEMKSEKTCESCGAPGDLTQYNRRLFIRCPPCSLELQVPKNIV